MSADFDTYEILQKKVVALGKVNKDIAEHIERSIDNSQVIFTRHKFVLKCNLEHNNNNNNRKDSTSKRWFVKPVKIKEKVIDRLESWQYKGEQLLLLPSHSFPDPTQLHIKGYKDVMRINQDLIQYGEKLLKKNLEIIDSSNELHSNFRESIIIELKKILSNLEIIQVAMGELHGLTLIPDRIEKEKEILKDEEKRAKIERCMSKVMDGFDELACQMSNVSLVLSSDD